MITANINTSIWFTNLYQGNKSWAKFLKNMLFYDVIVWHMACMLFKYFKFQMSSKMLLSVILYSRRLWLKKSDYSRSSQRRCSLWKDALRNFTKFRVLRQSLFFNKVPGLRPATLLKKILWRRCFPVNFVKFLRTPFLQNTSGRLLLLF